MHTHMIYLARSWGGHVVLHPRRSIMPPPVFQASHGRSDRMGHPLVPTLPPVGKVELVDDLGKLAVLIFHQLRDRSPCPRISVV